MTGNIAWTRDLRMFALSLSLSLIVFFFFFFFTIPYQEAYRPLGRTVEGLGGGGKWGGGGVKRGAEVKYLSCQTNRHKNILWCSNIFYFTLQWSISYAFVQSPPFPFCTWPGTATESLEGIRDLTTALTNPSLFTNTGECFAVVRQILYHYSYLAGNSIRPRLAG